ncbi:MAG: calcium/sodium antiporter [Candidatus Sumerlaeia bacterium]
MTLAFTFLFFIAGIVLLVGGADFAIVNAQRLGQRTGVSAVTLGVVVVAFGTSLPELLVTVLAALRGHPEIGIGNVVGSNIANVGLIVGLAAALAPFATQRRLVRIELPIVLASTILLYIAGRDQQLSRPDALVLLVCFSFYLAFVLTAERRSLLERAELATSATLQDGLAATARHHGHDGGHKDLESSPVLALKTAVGLCALLGGSYLIVENGAELARAMGVGETLIGLSLVAVGTSLPELAAALAAARRRNADLIMGNILGSNIFNILFILGVTVMIRPFSIPPVVAHTDAPIAGLFSLALLPLMLTGRVRRPAGVILLSSYAAYIGWRFVG